jgi:hypothetical protein
MIVVILGGSESLRSDVIRQLMQSDITLIKHLNIEGLVQFKNRTISRLMAEFEQSYKLTNIVTIVSGVTTNDELVYLRGKGAIVCHCYGQLTGIYEHISCTVGDKFILPHPLQFTAPDHIYSPDEVLSECYIGLINAL